jgi:glycerol-3-phosphate O-acyltransferase
MLTELLFTLTWWLRKPMLWLVRYRAAPEDLQARLHLDPPRPVCFVLPHRSWTDLFVLDRICKEHALPRPHRTGSDLPTVERPGFLYLSVLLEARSGRSRQRGAEVVGLVERAIGDPAYDVQLVPVSIFWGREPDKETSLFKLIFADSTQAGGLRKLFIILANGRNVLANFGLPVAFRAYMGGAEAQDPQRALRKLTRALHFHFLRVRTAMLGPSLVRRGVVIQGLLNARGVRQAIDQEAKDKGQTVEQVSRRAQKIAEEIAAYADAVDVLIVFPQIPRLDQVELLAEHVLPAYR